MAKKGGKKGRKKAEAALPAETPDIQAAETSQNTSPGEVQPEESPWADLDARPCVGQGYWTLSNREVDLIFKQARGAALGRVILRPSWQRVVGPIAAVYHARNGSLGLSLIRKWPATGAIVVWLPPPLAQRIRFADRYLLGMQVEVAAIFYTDDGGRTLQTNLASLDQLRFLYPESPHLPPCNAAKPGPETVDVENR